MAIALLATACDGGAQRGGARRPDAAADSATPDAAPTPDLAAPEAPIDVGPPPPPPTPELPRTPADPALTRRLVAGAITLAGDGVSSCGHASGATGDRWCAFVQTSELWVINVTRAIAGAIPACDGSSADCRRLASDLWTGTSLWGPSHPFAHRFVDDTLIFHTGATAVNAALHEGTVWAWRPEWSAPVKLTDGSGRHCLIRSGSDAVACVSNAIVDKDPTAAFDRPRLREHDLSTGRIGATGATLARAGRVVNAGGEAAARVRIAPGGGHLVFSRVPEPGAPETVDVVAIGAAAPARLLSGAAEWELAHDGAKIYYLTGLDRQLGETATGTLMLADFPSGANPVELARGVFAFERLGRGPADQGVALLRAAATGEPRFALLRDRTRPAEIFELAAGWRLVEVASDLRHTLYFRNLRNAPFPVGFIARNDGSGSCQLTTDTRAETYGSGFTASGRSVFWIEYGRAGSESEEGWYARPDACDQKVKFGDFVFSYQLVDEAFVVFEGGDLADTTSWLQVTRLARAGEAPGLPIVIREKPDPTVAVIRAADAAHVVFTTAHGEPGLYLHGGLR